MNVNNWSDLNRRRCELASVTDIPNVLEYAEAWRDLGEDFDKIGYHATADVCYANWNRYGGMVHTHYRRVTVGAFDILEAV